MPKDPIITYAVLTTMALLPIVALPVVGAQIVETFTQETGGEDRLPASDGEPVRLVTSPLLSAGGRMTDSLVAVIDLPDRTHANALCERAPRLRDTLQLFSADNPSRTDPRTRVPGQDPELQTVLQAKFADIEINAVRLTEPTAYKELYPSRDVYECQGLSYRRIATKSER